MRRSDCNSDHRRRGKINAPSSLFFPFLRWRKNNQHREILFDALLLVYARTKDSLSHHHQAPSFWPLFISNERRNGQSEKNGTRASGIITILHIDRAWSPLSCLFILCRLLRARTAGRPSFSPLRRHISTNLRSEFPEGSLLENVDIGRNGHEATRTSFFPPFSFSRFTLCRYDVNIYTDSCCLIKIRPAVVGGTGNGERTKAYNHGAEGFKGFEQLCVTYWSTVVRVCLIYFRSI